MKKISFDEIEDAIYINIEQMSIFKRNTISKKIRSESYCFVNYDFLGDKLIEIRILDAPKFFSQEFINSLKNKSIKSSLIKIHEVNFSDSLKKRVIDEIEKNYINMDPETKTEFQELVRKI